MTLKTSTILSIIVFGVLAVVSCKKNDEGPKIPGCIDSLSTNYNKLANSDDGSCVFPADKLVGAWKCKEAVSSFNSSTFSSSTLPTANFNATITKSDKTSITIVGDRATTPVYVYTKPLSIVWKTLTIGLSGSTISGVITDENNFTVSYTYGTLTSPQIIYSVKQTYTR